MKTGWLPNLVVRTLEGSISMSEASRYVDWRLRQNRKNLRVEGLDFEGVDRKVWGMIAGIMIRREYTPRGFSIGADDLVLDIGSHRGVFVGFAANRTRSKILAIEPHTENFRQLSRFVRINGLTNVQLFNKAVSQARGEARLYLSPGSTRHTLSGVDIKTGRILHEYVTVQTFTLDELLDPYRIVHFAKIDCEGAEYEIIDSAERTTLEKLQRLVMEVHFLENRDRTEALLRRCDSIFSRVSLLRLSPQVGILFCKVA